jgi:DNA-binding transcriptional MerR regulator
MNLAGLSRASGVTPRTIRYYINQGLLPSPGKRGRGASYDPALVERLALIKRLQAERWPLARIRAEIEGGARRKEEGGTSTSVRPSASYLPPQRSTWEHVPVSTHVEISFRSMLPTDQKKLVDRLIELARTMFAPAEGR